MTVHNEHPWEHPEIKLANQAQYVWGFALSLALLGVSLLLVLNHAETPSGLIATVSVIAFLATAVKLILLFHLDFSETQRWNTITLMMNVPLLILSVGLTMWMFSELYSHVMSTGMPGMPMR
jgi:cytochrome o ubiquinol oxidase operon protein cyoD